MPSLYDLIFYFFIYAFLGWCIEVIFTSVRKKTFVNRGFLIGPICPIYGFGACAVIIALTPLKENPLLLFFCAVLITSALEFIAGFLLELIFKQKWWDYSDSPLNIMGYISVLFSIFWGICSVVMIYWVQPFAAELVSVPPANVGWILSGLLLFAFAADAILTFIDIFTFRTTIRRLNEIEIILRRILNLRRENIADIVFAVAEEKDNIAQKFEETRARYHDFFAKRKILNFNDLKENYLKLLQKSELRVGSRLSAAFPHLKTQPLFVMAEKRLQSIKKISKIRKK